MENALYKYIIIIIIIIITTVFTARQTKQWKYGTPERDSVLQHSTITMTRYVLTFSPSLSIWILVLY